MVSTLAVNPSLGISVDTDGMTTVYVPQTDRYFRLRPTEASLLTVIDGVSRADLAAAMGVSDDDERLTKVLDRFEEFGFVGSPTPTRTGRVRRTGTASWQVSLIDPSRLLDRFSRVTAVAGSVQVFLLALCIGALGLVLLLTSGEVLRGGFEGTVVLGTGLALLLTTVGHEAAHAVSLAAVGGTPRRAGVMLLHGLPVAFCDVTDSWLLKHRRDRFRVAAAGIAFHAACGGVASMVMLATPRGGLQSAMALYAVACYGVCLWNLNPFMRMDGYWMLSAVTGIANLRARAFAAAHSAIRRLLTGEGDDARARLLATFGIACAVVTPVVVLGCAVAYQRLLFDLGRVGAVAWIAALLTALWFAAERVRAFVASLPSDKRFTARSIAILGVGVVLLCAVGFVRVPSLISVDYAIDDKGVFVLERTMSLHPGTEVVVYESSASVSATQRVTVSSVLGDRRIELAAERSLPERGVIRQLSVERRVAELVWTNLFGRAIAHLS